MGASSQGYSQKSFDGESVRFSSFVPGLFSAGIDLGRAIHVGVNVRQVFLVARQDHAMAAGLRGDPRPRSAVDAHRIEVVLGSARLAGGEVELRPSLESSTSVTSNLPDVSCFGIAAQRRDGVEMIPAIALAFEIDLVAILEPAERVIAGAVQPGVVMLVEQRGGFRRTPCRATESSDPYCRRSERPSQREFPVR